MDVALGVIDGGRVGGWEVGSSMHSYLMLGVFDGGPGGVLVAVVCSIEVGWVKWRVGC